MQLPEPLIASLEKVKGFEKSAFIDAHADPEPVTSIRLNPAKCGGSNNNFSIESRVPWAAHGFYLTERPSFTFDPLFHAGTYYVQEASSMFIEQAIRQTCDLGQPLRVLDLCAAPGGKSTHLQSLIDPSGLLVSNDVIRSRGSILKENMIKWGSNNVVVTSNDPKDFARLGEYFDVIVVDAPCSGSGLFRKDPAAIDEWSTDNVSLCSQRQQRILADVWPSLKKDGVLIYSTCSYSREEDEDIIDWMAATFSVKNMPLLLDENWNITATTSSSGATAYRFWPDRLKGEGFFLACMKKTSGEGPSYLRVKGGAENLSKNELSIVDKWLSPDHLHFIKHGSTVYAWPNTLVKDFNVLLQSLRVIYSGTIIGELMKDKLVPDHSFAMSGFVDTAILRTELEKASAIAYLQRRDIPVHIGGKGWQLVTFLGNPLGWINVLANRINNYYPKEFRILKDK